MSSYKEILGKKIGEGMHRSVYQHKDYDDIVIKVMKDNSSRPDHNLIEYNNWRNAPKDIRNYLIEVISVTRDGKYLMQRKGGDIIDPPKDIPKIIKYRFPDSFLPGNNDWRAFGGDSRLCDYGFSKL